MRAKACLAAAFSVALCGCADFRVPLTHRTAPVDHHRVEAGDWQLLVSRDRASGDVTCRLGASDGKAFVVGASIAFAFPDETNTHAASYRIGGDAPRRWREDLPELLRIGAPMERGGVENPAQGLVWIPLRRLEAANAIEITAQPGSAPRTFRIGGLKGLRQAAIARGCTPASRLVH